MVRRIVPALAALALAACVDNRSSVSIRGRAFPTDFTTCKFSATGEFFLGAGRLDVAFQTSLGYSMVLYVQNNLADPTEVTTGTVTSAKAWRALAARVRLNPSDYLTDFLPTASQLLPLQSEVRIPLDGQTVDPGGSSAQGVDVVNFGLGSQIRTACAGAPAGACDATHALRAVLGITLEGETLDGAKLDTGEWFYSVDVCNGCLAVCPAGAVCPTPATGTCAAGTPAATSCGQLGQDSPPVCI